MCNCKTCCTCSEPEKEPTVLTMESKVETRSGFPVRLLCTDKRGDSPVVGLLLHDGVEHVFSWAKTGKRSGCGSSDYDLVPVKQKWTRYITVVQFVNGKIATFASNHPIKVHEGERVLGVQKVTITEGDTV
jgi:hypothetical protein